MSIPVILAELAKIGFVKLTEESAKAFVETKIKPIFASWGKEDLRTARLEECLSEYLMRCYKDNNIMTTVVFGKLQKTLEDLYIPLTLEEYRDEDQKWIVNENCYDILDKYNRVLIVDKAGMGKSTIVKFFACQGVNLNKIIPIVIKLSKLKKEQTILEYIQKHINSHENIIELNELVHILQRGDFVIFFDGYDEITNANKPDALDAIQEFTSKASNTKVIITSREEEDLTSLGEFKCVNIKPLTNNEAYELIRKYDNNGDISKKLIKRLKEDSTMTVLSEFLENPLLVSLLYKTFEYKEEIPYKKIDFYEQVYVALFNDHDKTKGAAYVHEKETKLDRFQFEQILRAFGFLALKTDKVEYSPQLIHQMLKQSIDRFGWLKISVDDFLYDITHAVPFIQKDGNEYKWVHKSFMEYFAACFICYDNKEFEEKYLKKMTIADNSMKYYNVLDFCYEMDTLNYRKYIILPYLENYVDTYDKSFISDCFKLYKKEQLHLAKQIISISKEIIVIKYNISNDDDMQKYRNDLTEYFKKYKYYNIDVFEDGNQVLVMLYEYKKPVVYIFMKEKMQELFEDIAIKQIGYLNIKNGVEYYFNDDINNPINMDKKLFSIFLEKVALKIFNNRSSFEEERYSVLNYNKCGEIIKEIKEEQGFQNSSLFDL